MDKINYSEPWFKCGRSNREWFNFFNSIQSSGFSCNFTKEQFEEFFLDKKTGVDKKWI